MQHSCLQAKLKQQVEDWVNKILLDIGVDNSAFEEKYKQSTKHEIYSWDEMKSMFFQVRAIRNCLMNISKKNMEYENILRHKHDNRISRERLQFEAVTKILSLPSDKY